MRNFCDELLGRGGRTGRFRRGSRDRGWRRCHRRRSNAGDVGCRLDGFVVAWRARRPNDRRLRNRVRLNRWLRFEQQISEATGKHECSKNEQGRSGRAALGGRRFHGSLTVGCFDVNSFHRCSRRRYQNARLAIFNAPHYTTGVADSCGRNWGISPCSLPINRDSREPFSQRKLAV